MENIKIEATDYSPEIDFNFSANTLLLKGKLDLPRFSGECLLLTFMFNRRTSWAPKELRNFGPKRFALL